jgi:hypothetical protein
MVTAFLPDTNVWISLLKNPGGKLETKTCESGFLEFSIFSRLRSDIGY